MSGGLMSGGRMSGGRLSRGLKSYEPQRQVRQPSLTVSQPIIDCFMQFVQL